MDGLLRLKKPVAKTVTTGKPRSDSVVSESNAPLVVSAFSSKNDKSHVHMAVVEQPVNFDLLEKEFDASLFACFTSVPSITSTSSTSASVSGSSTAAKEAPKSAKKAKKAPSAEEPEQHVDVPAVAAVLPETVATTPVRATGRKPRKASIDETSESESAHTSIAAAPLAAPATASKKSSAAATAELLLAAAPTRTSSRKRSMSNLSEASSVPSVSDEGTRRSTRTKK